MRILHYTLGLPPYRSGGLTKYATDLMCYQAHNHEVTLLYPGNFSIFKKNKHYKFNKYYQDIRVYELKNAVCIPLLYGTRSPLSLIGDDNQWSQDNMESFFNLIQPEIFHIHTLMGLPREWILFLNRKKIPIIYTSHDYYGICLKVNFINHLNTVCPTANAHNCAICNTNAPSNIFLRVRNLKCIIKFKKVIQKIPIHKKRTTSNQSLLPIKEITIQEYQKLLDYYKSFFQHIDCIHFNSSVSKIVYEHYIKCKRSVIISISHKDIADNRHIKKIGNSIKIGFIGHTSAYKGLPLLLSALIELHNKGITNWSLTIWGNSFKDPNNKYQNIHYKGKYKQDQISLIYNDIDLLVVPSIWKETFSLVTLEALSYGVPCLVTNNVGAKDIISQIDESFIIKIEELQTRLEGLLRNTQELIQYNEKIVKVDWKYTLKYHVKEITDLYKLLINEI